MTTWYYKLAAVLAAVALAIVGYRVWEHHMYTQGYSVRDGEAKTEEARLSADATAKQSTAAGEAWRREQDLRADLDAADAKRFKENADHEKINAALLARVRSGELRLSIAVKSGSLPDRAPATNPATAGGPGAETRADLMPGTVESILSIAGRSASDVRDYNALVDRYNRARETCNAVTP